MNHAEKNTLETILVVDDQPAVREIVRVILKRAGFCVLAAGSGAAAIKVESMTQGTIHLLLSDVTMPDMSGPVVAERLKKRRPEMYVMLMSGYPGSDMLSLNHGWHFIAKPFLAAELVEKVNEVLHTPERRRKEIHLGNPPFELNHSVRKPSRLAGAVSRFYMESRLKGL